MASPAKSVKPEDLANQKKAEETKAKEQLNKANQGIQDAKIPTKLGDSKESRAASPPVNADKLKQDAKKAAGGEKPLTTPQKASGSS